MINCVLKTDWQDGQEPENVLVVSVPVLPRKGETIVVVDPDAIAAGSDHPPWPRYLVLAVEHRVAAGAIHPPGTGSWMTAILTVEIVRAEALT